MDRTNLTFQMKSVQGRLAAAAAIAFALLLGWFSVRWQVGDMLAELTAPSAEDARVISEYATELAPQDPRGWWLSANTHKDLLTPENIEDSVRTYEKVVRLSPHDFRWWIELGRAYEQAARPDEAETSLKQALQLAPTYAYGHWQLANFLLRQGRIDEARTELKRSTINNATYRNQVFSLAWDFFGKDPSKVEELAAEGPDVSADLATFYAYRDRADDSLRVWNSMTESEKAERAPVARLLAQVLYERFAFQQSLEFAKQSGVDPNVKAETINNPGFEEVVRAPEETFFGWRIARDDSRSEVGVETSVKHSGQRSLKTVFRNYLKPTFYGFGQNVAVTGNKRYQLQYWYRTENLKSGGTPVIEIVRAKDNAILAVSKPFLTGTNDWTQNLIQFATPEDCVSVYVRVNRAYCGDACPVSGTMWIDDFELRND